jgi:hypothetical protein
MTHQNPPPATTRTQVLRTILSGLNAGELPAPNAIRFQDALVNIDLDSAADLNLWAEYFEFATALATYSQQPHPDLANPANSDEWITSAWRNWNGWMLSLHATDPITDAQRQQWIDSGQAARFQGGDDDA